MSGVVEEYGTCSRTIGSEEGEKPWGWKSPCWLSNSDTTSQHVFRHESYLAPVAWRELASHRWTWSPRCFAENYLEPSWLRREWFSDGGKTYSLPENVAAFVINTTDVCLSSHHFSFELHNVKAVFPPMLPIQHKLSDQKIELGKELSVNFEGIVVPKARKK